MRRLSSLPCPRLSAAGGRAQHTQLESDSGKIMVPLMCKHNAAPTRLQMCMVQIGKEWLSRFSAGEILHGLIRPTLLFWCSVLLSIGQSMWMTSKSLGTLKPQFSPLCCGDDYSLSLLEHQVKEQNPESFADHKVLHMLPAALPMVPSLRYTLYSSSCSSIAFIMCQAWC